jgi:hypothetical protein
MNKNMDYTKFLGRSEMEEHIKGLLSQFPLLDKCSKRNIYIRGNSGVGKTSFVTRILAEMEYEVVYYETGETKNNNNLLELLTKNTLSCSNVMSSFKKEKKKHVVLIDDTDSLSIGDKPTLTALIKLVRPKKTKKQQTEAFNTIPIVFVGNMHIDKNLKDLINVCHTFEIYPPTIEQMTQIVQDVFPTITNNPADCDDVVGYIGEDLSKLSLTHEYYRDNPSQLLHDIQTIFVRKTKNSDRSQKIHQLYHTNIPLRFHSQFINETDRTTVSLLWHENVIDILKHYPLEKTDQPNAPLHLLQPVASTRDLSLPAASHPPAASSSTVATKKSKKTSTATTTSKRKPSSKSTVVAVSPLSSLSPHNVTNHLSVQRTLPVYVRMLDNICYSDYIDRTTFQKQVWKLNEISSIIKTFKNNHILHSDLFSRTTLPLEHLLPKEVRFTKILTKYSSEYNNFWFIRNTCQTLGIDKNDLFEQVIQYCHTGNSPQANLQEVASPSNSIPQHNHPPRHLLEWFEANEFDMTTLNRLIKYYKVCASGMMLPNMVDASCTDGLLAEIDPDMLPVECL